MSDEKTHDFVPVVEALIFAADEPLSTRHLVELIPELEAEQLSEVLARLDEQLEEHSRGIRLEEVAGGWRFTTRPEHGPFLERLFRGRRTQRLTQAALETVAVVLYRQPTTKAEIEAIRGVSVDGPLRTLLDRNLIKVSGRAEGPGRPLLYATTRELLKHLGLRDLRDLPQLDELEGVLAGSEEGDPDQLELGELERDEEEDAASPQAIEAAEGDEERDESAQGDGSEQGPQEGGEGRDEEPREAGSEGAEGAADRRPAEPAAPGEAPAAGTGAERRHGD